MRTARALTLTAALAAVVLPSAIACSSSSTEHAGASSDFALSLGSGTLAMAVGESVTLHASPVAADGTAFAGLYTLSWASSNAAAVAVAADGTLTALAAGSATITATATRIDTGAGATASVAVTVGGGSPPPPPPPTSGSTLRPDVSGLCLSAAAAIADGTRIMQADCATAPLRFIETADAVGSELRIAGTSFCIDLPHGSANDGDLLQLLHCDGSSDQRFSPIAYANGRRGFRAVTSGKCFDVQGATPAPGALVQQWSCGDTPEQRFSTDSSGGGDAGGGGGDAGPPPVGSTQASFTADTAIELQNPERGYYFRVGPGEACSSVLTAVRDGADYQQKVKLVYYEANPATFDPSSFAADMGCVRAAGMKVVLSEVYCSTYLCNEGVSIDQAEAQLAAMAGPVQANRDVIAVVRIGVMGGWGEGASWNGGDVPDSVRTRVRDAVVSMAPPEIPLVHRNPLYVFQWYPVTTSATAFNGSVGSRIGIVNDCFLSGTDDHYTYPDPGLRAQTAAQTEFTPFGAEACDGSGQQNPQPNRLACTGGDLNDGSPGGIMNEGPRYHLTYLHRGYFDGYMTAWGGLDDQGNRGSGDCYDAVTNSMGYRFQLDAVTHPQAALGGESAQVDVDLRNVGWARIFSARKLVVTLKHRTNAAAPAIVGEGGDARMLPSQATSSSRVRVTVAIPTGATAGDYDVFLGMPDVWPQTKGDARQAVRFANADDAAKGQAWDAANARLKVGTTLTVQ